MTESLNRILFESRIISQVSVFKYYFLNSLAVIAFVSIIFFIRIWHSEDHNQFGTALIFTSVFLCLVIAYLAYIAWVGARVFVYHISLEDEFVIIKYRHGKQLFSHVFKLRNVDVKMEPRGRSSPVLLIRCRHEGDFVIEQKINSFWTKDKMRQIVKDFKDIQS